MRKRDKWNYFADPAEEQKKLDDDRAKKRARYKKKGTGNTEANKAFHIKQSDI